MRQIVVWLLSRELNVQAYELSVQFVGTAEMTILNEKYLRHKGPTDVITFDYGSSPQQLQLAGDVIICVDEAITQAPRFQANWHSELVRYVVHGLLHLQGFDDKTVRSRHRMKRREDEVMRSIARRFAMAKVAARAGRN